MRVVILSILALFCVASLVGCGDSSAPIQIRIRNASDQDFTAFWLGAGGSGPSPVAFGAVRRGETTRYKAFGAVLAEYRKSNFITADGSKFVDVVYPEAHVGTPELAPGRYTFAYTVRDGKPVLALTRDN